GGRRMGSGISEQSRTFWLRAYQDHGPSILAFLTSRVGRRELAEDFLQETFVRVMRKMTKGFEGANLRSYLFTTMAPPEIWKRIGGTTCAASTSTEVFYTSSPASDALLARCEGASPVGRPPSGPPSTKISRSGLDSGLIHQMMGCD